MYIRNKKMILGKKKSYYVIEDRIKIKGKYVTKNIKYLGTAEKVLLDMQELDKLKNKKS